MSVAYYIALNKEDIDFDSFVNGKAFASASDGIIDLCESKDFKPFDDYLSGDPSEFLDDIELPDDFEVQWYEAKEGVDYITKLKQLIDSCDCEFDKAPVIEDLDEYISVLTKAKEANLKWHLALDM